MVRSNSTLVPEQGGDDRAHSRFMTPPEVASLFSIPVSTLRFWAWNEVSAPGFPKPVKIGRANRYPRVEVIAWLEAQIAASRSGEGS